MAKKILVVDDDPEVLEIVGEFLTVRQYQVFTTPDGRQVPDLALKHEPDLIILDVVMPEINGFEILKILKSNPLTAYIPVIMLTGQTAPEMQISGLITGADDYVTKPFDLNVLYARILTALRHTIVPTRLKKEQINLLNYLIGVYSKRGYDCYTKLLDQYKPHPPHWRGFVPDLIAQKPGKLRALLFETAQSLMEESFIERINSLVECEKNTTGKFRPEIVVRTKENYKLVKKILEEQNLEIEIKLFPKRLRRSD